MRSPPFSLSRSVSTATPRSWSVPLSIPGFPLSTWNLHRLPALAKLQAPLFGLSASGTLGDTLTYARLGQRHVVKSVPTHLDANTLLQSYQRRRFQDAVWYWHDLSDAERTAYRTLAVGKHMPPWARFLRVYLANPLDQVLWLPLDEFGGAIAGDRSGKSNHATVFGSQIVPGVIINARSFDGIDDYVNVPASPELDTTEEFTVLFWWLIAARTRWDYILRRRGVQDLVWFQMDGWPQDGFQAVIRRADGIKGLSVQVDIPLGVWNHVAVTYDGSALRAYMDGVLVASDDYGAGAVLSDLTAEWRLCWASAADWFPGTIDEFRVYNRALGQPQIDMIMRQRWPN